MRQWRDCRTTGERQAALADAMALGGGRVSRAAKLLGISRQHLHKVLTASRDSSQGVITRDSVATVKRGDAVAASGGGTRNAAVSPTFGQPLTYGARGRILSGVSSASVTTTEATEETIRVALDLPRSLKDRLERDALEAKQRGETSRASQSHVVIKALRRYYAEEGE